MNFMILSNIFGAFMGLFGACDKIMKIMDYEPKIKYRNYQTTKPKQYDIQLKNVNFTYPSTEEGNPVL